MRSGRPDNPTDKTEVIVLTADAVFEAQARATFGASDQIVLRVISGTLVAVEAVRERLADGPQPQVVINRFEQPLFTSGLRRGDIEQVLGDAFSACIPNNYGLVREAIDRGVPLDEVKPGNKITQQLRKLILPQPVARPPSAQAGESAKKLRLGFARG